MLFVSADPEPPLLPDACAVTWYVPAAVNKLAQLSAFVSDVCPLSEPLTLRRPPKLKKKRAAFALPHTHLSSKVRVPVKVAV